MPDLPTRAELFEIGADETLRRSEARPPGSRISPEQIYAEGSDANIVNASASAMSEEVLRQLARRIKALFLDGAEGEDLDRLVADRFSTEIVRKAATPAVGIVSFTRIAGAMPGGVLAAGTRLRATNGVEFQTTAACTIVAGSAGPFTVAVQARTAGYTGNVAEGSVSAFVSPPFDTNLLVTNDEPMAGGDVTESDARLRARARQFYRTARRGIGAAIEFGALTVPGIRQAVATELLDPDGRPNGVVELYVADALGQANAALTDAVLLALDEYRALGVYVHVLSAIPTFVTIRLRLRFEAGVDSTRAFALVRNAVVARVNNLRPNQILPRSLIESACSSVTGVIVLDDAVVEPVGDLVPSAGQVIRTSAELVLSV